MSDAIFLQRGVRDPRLAVHATSSMPAWLWSIDGARVLWANPAAAKIFGARDAVELAARIFSPADQHRRQVMQLAATLSQSGATRMDRLRGFGAPLGRPLTCACARLSFADGATAILVAAAEAVGRPQSLDERVANLLGNFAKPALAFTPDGALIATNDAATNLATHLADLGDARVEALDRSEAEIETEFAHGTVYRAGIAHETALVALFDKVDMPDAVGIATPAEILSADDILPEPVAGFVASETIIETPRLDDIVVPMIAPAASAQPPRVENPVPPEDPAPVKETAPHEADTHRIAATLADMDGAHLSPRRHPLRFIWQMDEDGRFSLGSDEFSRLIGTRTAAAFGRLWSEVADALGLDPDNEVAAAVATRDTWSGIVVYWPSDGVGGRLPVELSGLPIYDRVRNFIGYRGFGVCRDLDGLTRLAAQRRDEMLYSAPPSKPAAPSAIVLPEQPEVPNEAAVDTPINVVPFRPASEPKSPALTAVESNAFDELARRLSARLDGDAATVDVDAPVSIDETAAEIEQPAEHPPAFLQPEALPLRANSSQDTQLLDRLPVGVLVYRLDRLIYANRAFLESTGFNGLHELTEAGGLDALYVEPTSGSGASTSEGGTAVTISNSKNTSAPHDAKLFTIAWDNEPAMALMFSGPRAEPVAASAIAVTPLQDDATLAEDLSTILDTTAEGIVMFDALGRVLSCNRSAEALFGRSGDEIATLNLIDLFAPESQRAVLDYLESAKSATIASLLDHGREMLGRMRDGSTIPVSMTMGRTRPDSARFFAVFRDLAPVRKTESDILQARRQAERATSARSEVLGRISHDVRTPLNAIIGFADVMIAERFGPLGNERYAEYLKDIRASGERVMAIIDDLLNLSRIESGKMELAFVNQDLNSLVEQCVAVMQPQANRERIIIRTSLAHALPAVKADARALRQITLNLIGSSIHLANAGGQVIVSTATTDFGDIVLRVRDTGHGLNDNEIAVAMAPFRTAAATDQISSDDSAVSLSLTKALVEANRAKFQIKTAGHSGTLIEVVFSHASAIA